MSDSYRTVTAPFRHLTKYAFFIDRPRAVGQRGNAPKEEWEG